MTIYYEDVQFQKKKKKANNENVSHANLSWWCMEKLCGMIARGGVRAIGTNDPYNKSIHLG